MAGPSSSSSSVLSPRSWNRCAPILFIALVFVCVIFITESGDGNGGGGGGGASAAGAAAAAHFVHQDTSKGVVTTDDVLNGRFYARGSNSTWDDLDEGVDWLSWLSGGTGDLVLFNPENHEKRIAVGAGQFVSRPWKFSFSGDGKFLLTSFEPKRLYRSTIIAKYAVHDAKSGKLIQQLRTNLTPQHPPGVNEEPETFQLATFSNDNKTILVVNKNDLYAIRIDTAAEAMVTKRLTADGSDSVFNGIADWVYEEEVLSSSTSVFSSPKGMHVSYLKFNDSDVEAVNYNLYGDFTSEPYFDLEYQYAKYGTVRYPKTGTSNPTVSVHVVKLGDDACWGTIATHPRSDCTWDFLIDDLMKRLVNPSGGGGGVGNSLPTDYYNDSNAEFIIGSFHWIRENSFVMNILNRVQNTTWVVECSVADRDCSIVRSTNKSGGWIDVSPLFHYGNDEYLSLSSVSESNGYEFIQIVGISQNRFRVLTPGHYSVDEIVGVYPGWNNGNQDILIFKAPLITIPSDNNSGSPYLADPSQMHYYALEISNSTSSSSPRCLTCDYSTCTYNTAKFSEHGTKFVNSCERKDEVMSVEVVRIHPNLTTSIVTVLEHNNALQRALSGVTLPEVEYFNIPYTLEGSRQYNLSVKVIGPKGWMSGEEKQFPVVMDTYSGPNSQKVTRRFQPNDWSFALASKTTTPVVYVVVDGIGSGRQSSSLSFEVYRDLGNKEVLDKIFALKHILAKYKSLDPGRTLLWGWSYGGYVSSMAMGRDTEHIFKCGISVAPVTNWHYYDTIYTERYMGLPWENPSGYNTSNVLRYLDNFRQKDFLLVHGNADDNVHYQQSMALARGLEQRSILFRLMSYPDENHSLGGVRPHLFRTLEDFAFNQCFAKRHVVK